MGCFVSSDAQNGKMSILLSMDHIGQFVHHWDKILEADG
jgi:hypothetical protein